MQTEFCFDITANRHRGSVTSMEAEERVRPHKAEMWDKIHSYIAAQGKYGATTKEVRDGLKMHYTTASARLSEMKANGMVAVTDRRRAGAAVVVVR